MYSGSVPIFCLSTYHPFPVCLECQSWTTCSWDRPEFPTTCSSWQTPAGFPPFPCQLQENIMSTSKTLIQVKNSCWCSAHLGIVLYPQYGPAGTSRESKQPFWYEAWHFSQPPSCTLAISYQVRGGVRILLAAAMLWYVPPGHIPQRASGSCQHWTLLRLFSAPQGFSDFFVSSQGMKQVSEPDGAEGGEDMSPWLGDANRFGAQSLTSAEHLSAKTCKYYQTRPEAASEWKC